MTRRSETIQILPPSSSKIGRFTSYWCLRAMKPLSTKTITSPPAAKVGSSVSMPYSSLYLNTSSSYPNFCAIRIRSLASICGIDSPNIF